MPSFLDNETDEETNVALDENFQTLLIHRLAIVHQELDLLHSRKVRYLQTVQLHKFLDLYLFYIFQIQQYHHRIFFLPVLSQVFLRVVVEQRYSLVHSLSFIKHGLYVEIVSFGRRICLFKRNCK